MTALNPSPIGLLPSWFGAWTRNIRGIFQGNIFKTRSSIDKKLCKEAAVNRAPAVIQQYLLNHPYICSAAQSTIYSLFRGLVCKISSWWYSSRKRVSISLALVLGGGMLSFWLSSLEWNSMHLPFSAIGNFTLIDDQCNQASTPIASWDKCETTPSSIIIIHI